MNQQKSRNRLIKSENKLVVARMEGDEGIDKIGEGDQVQTSSYEINKS